MTAPGWRLISASSVGTSHLGLGTPCQDHGRCQVLHDSQGEAILVVAVSDGAGSAKHAEIGSEIACATAMACAEGFLGQGLGARDINVETGRAWVAAIQAMLEARAAADEQTIRDYACTLLVAVVGAQEAAFMQIGDGAIVVPADEAGGWRWVHWPQRGEFVNTTHFVTEKDAPDRLAFVRHEGPLDEVAVFTDGIEPLVLHYATQTVHAPFFDQMFPPVRSVVAEGLDERLSAALGKYLASPVICDRTDDDKTLVLASRRAPEARTLLDAEQAAQP